MYPQLDHYVGRSVENVEWDDEGYWSIRLDGGIQIANLDAANAVPQETLESLEGLTYLQTGLSKDGTTLVFGVATKGEILNRVDIVLNPLEYTVTTPEFQQGWYPQRPPEDQPKGDGESGEDWVEIQTPGDIDLGTAESDSEGENDEEAPEGQDE